MSNLCNGMVWTEARISKEVAKGGGLPSDVGELEHSKIDCASTSSLNEL